MEVHVFLLYTIICMKNVIVQKNTMETTVKPSVSLTELNLALGPSPGKPVGIFTNPV
jgi:hypothetical protein